MSRAPAPGSVFGEAPTGAAGAQRQQMARPALITGGAGFVGCNLADRLAQSGRRVLIFDSLARSGVQRNLEWLLSRHGARISVKVGDVRDLAALRAAVGQCSEVYHLAAQVAVTTSVVDPVADFEVNARGTLNVLEAVRDQETPPPVLFTSTNKVYGGLLGENELGCDGTRYWPRDSSHGEGFSEDQPLEFCSPYGCSKGAADQYVLDYARVFRLNAVVFRMSCIYGPHQFGTEDQGWVAHFLISALLGRTITIFGDGRQVRDVLFIDDLVEAMLAAMQRAPELRGHAFNIGGGSANAVSLLQLLELIRARTGIEPRVQFVAPRPGDQLFYVSDPARFHALTGWQPRTSVRDGLEQLLQWLSHSLHPSFGIPGEVA
jgi:CDP-paratose 2-epimerase